MYGMFIPTEVLATAVKSIPPAEWELIQKINKIAVEYSVRKLYPVVFSRISRCTQVTMAYIKKENYEGDLEPLVEYILDELEKKAGE